MNSLSRSTKWMSLGFSFFLILMDCYSVQASEQTTEIFSACQKGSERVEWSESFPKEWRNQLEKSYESQKGPEMFERASAVFRNTNAPYPIREFAEYLRAKSYHIEGLDHVAYKKFYELSSKEIGTQISIESRIAAIECMMRLQNEHPSLTVKSPAHSDILRRLLQRSDLTVAQRRIVAQFLTIRMKELVNKWDKNEIEVILDALKSDVPFLIYAQLLVVQRHGNYVKAVSFLEQLIEKGRLPREFQNDRETLILIYARDLYEMKRFQKSADVVRLIPRDSNYLPQALSDLTWALLMAGKKREAVGTAFNIQKSLLNKTFTPEAPLVASIAYFEMCQYARALKNSVYFKKKYLPVLSWYKRLTIEQTEKPYEMLTASLRKKDSVPNVVLLEWLRSPEFRALQGEANALFTERRLAYNLVAERLNAEKGSYWVKEWKAPLAEFYKGTKNTQREIGQRLNKVLKNVNKRIASGIGRLIENTQLLEIEIFDAAGEDMVWRNINPEYTKWASEQPDEKRDPDRLWVWGEVPVDPASKDEIWEDELGWTLGNVDDECRLKNRFKQNRAKEVTSTAATN
jgi:hypothetical protein